MIGAGFLLRFAFRAGGKYAGRIGLLPSKWYLRDALEALSEDDFPRAIRCLHYAHNGPSERWELIRQQAVFRCRLLIHGHREALKRLEKAYQAGFIQGTTEVDFRRVRDLHREAIRILSNYETDLRNLTSLQEAH